MTDRPPGDVTQTAGVGVPEPRITVLGVGGAGGNAIDNMIRAKLDGVEFVVTNTDAQALEQSLCDTQIQLGASLTKGLGAGANPATGRAAAEETMEALVDALRGSDMAFITAGMGGGTGTGGAPVIARLARDEGVLTVGVVTKPFQFEGAHRMRQAEAGIAELAQYVDTLIVIPNQNLFLIADDKTTFADAFRMADDVLHSGVRGVTDLMVMPGLVNLDFADVRSTMAGMGKAVMGTGEAEGDDRALAAAEAAISNPLLDDVTMTGARNVIINITGGLDLMLAEVDEAASRIRAEVHPDANIIFGSAFSETLNGRIRVSVIATGGDAVTSQQAAPVSRSLPAGQAAEQAGEQHASPVRATVSAAPRGAAEPEPRAEEPLTLRLVSSVPAGAKEAQSGAAAAPVSSTPLAADSEPGERRTDPAPERQSETRTEQEAEAGLKEKFSRPARPVKSQSTHEAVDADRRQTESVEDNESEIRYVVWETDLGARIYKVPTAQVAALQEEPHADRLKLFDDLEKAKVAADTIIKRISAERRAKGLPRSIMETILDDMQRWDESGVPDYFIRLRP